MMESGNQDVKDMRLPSAGAAAALAGAQPLGFVLTPQIGLCVGRNEKTVRNRLTRLYSKLGVVNRTEAVSAHLWAEFRGRRPCWMIDAGRAAGLPTSDRRNRNQTVQV